MRSMRTGSIPMDDSQERLIPRTVSLASVASVAVDSVVQRSPSTRSELINQADSSTQSVEEIKRKRWSLEQGFYAAMGGYIVSIEEQDEWILDDGKTVTPAGILALAGLDMLPDVDKSTVTVKSKADGVTKTLVVIQAVWMVIQSLVRQSGLHVTLLELNTLAHVVCAVAMYGLWWKKPQDVKESMEIQLELDLATFMSSYQFRRKFEATIDDRNEATDKRSKAWMSLVPNRSGYTICGSVKGHYSELDPPNDNQFSRRFSKPDGVVMLFPGQSLKGIPVALQEGYGDSPPSHLTIYEVTCFQ